VSTKNIFLSLVFSLVLILSGFLRYTQVKNYNFPLTFDQARDLLDIRVLAGFHDFKISGPTTSITGLNLGPYYYIFNLPAFWLGGGDPQALVVYNIFWFLLTACVIYLYFYKKNIHIGLIFSLTFLMAPQLFPITHYFWNAHTVIYFVVFYFLSLLTFLESKSPKSAIILGIFSALVIQFEAAFGSLCFAFSLLIVLFSKNRRNFKFFLVGSLPWFLPQLAYEVLHRFQMTRLFLGIFNGQNAILGQSSTLPQIFSTHLTTLLKYFEGQFMLPYGWGLILILPLIVFAAYKKIHPSITHVSLFIVFTLVYYSLIYRHPLKPWYLDGLRVWYCLVFSLVLGSLVRLRRLLYPLLAIFLLVSFTSTVSDQLKVYRQSLPSRDPKNAANLQTAIDWVYSNSKSVPFAAYNYVPETYDFSLQYLYWWYGTKTYGYQPLHVSYSFSPVPDYVRSSAVFSPPTPSKPVSTIALIYENQGQYLDWLGQFSHYCPQSKSTFTWGTTVEIRKLPPGDSPSCL
jgi:hypothetical protein